jgi:hypothetical protein
VQVHYDEGVAIYTGPEPCVGGQRLRLPISVACPHSATDRTFDIHLYLLAPRSRRASQNRRAGRLTRPMPRTSTPTASSTAPT